MLTHNRFLLGCLAVIWGPISEVSAWQFQTDPQLAPVDRPIMVAPDIGEFESPASQPWTDGATTSEIWQPNDATVDCACEPAQPWWKVQHLTGQLMWLSRSGPEDFLIYEAGIPDAIVPAVTNYTAALSSTDLALPIEAGFRGSALFGRVGNWQGELAYLGVFDQQTTQSTNFAAALGVTEVRYSFFDFIATTPVTAVSAAYESDLHSGEANFWYDDGWRFQAMIGARWIRQSELFEQYQTSATTTDRAEINLGNDLVGGQIGFKTNLFYNNRLSVFAIAKGGLYRNVTDMRVTILDAGTVFASFDAAENVTSYSGELNVTAMWQFAPWFNFHVGYTGLYLSKVALAPNQTNNFSLITSSGSFDYDGIAYNGGHLGVTFSW